MSQMATMLPYLAQWVESLSPLPPMPMLAMLIFSLGDLLAAGLASSAQAPRPTAQALMPMKAEDLRKSRRLCWLGCFMLSPEKDVCDVVVSRVASVCALANVATFDCAAGVNL